MDDIIKEYNILYVLIKYEHRSDNIRKVGCTNNISRRKFEYKMGNLYPVKFEGYFKIPKLEFNIFIVEKTIHRDLEDNFIYRDGGREFFKFKNNPLEVIKNILLNQDLYKYGCQHQVIGTMNSYDTFFLKKVNTLCVYRNMYHIYL